MSHGTDHHLEHAEHVQHQAHNPFDRRVAMTMSIMAAILAGATLASHRGHTETLRLATTASNFHTQANDQWSEYQAKNIRSHEYQAFLFMNAMMDKSVLKQDAEAKAMQSYWVKQVEKFEGKGYWKAFTESLTSGGERPKGSGGDRDVLSAEAKKLTKKAEAAEHESHQIHEQVTWIDMGHLGLELALVFCAVAVLTKSKPFWSVGMVFGLVGGGLAAYGIYTWWLIGAAEAAAHH
jgi:hypothetical protein